MFDDLHCSTSDSALRYSFSFDRMLKAARTMNFDLVVVWKSDLFSNIIRS